MEQNIEEQAAGSDCHLLWSGPGAADKAACVAVFLEQGAARPDCAAIVQAARGFDAAVYAYYISPTDLAHYGHMDHLATACDREDFVRYTAARDLEAARESFACLLHVESLAWRLEVLQRTSAVAPCLERLKARKDCVKVFGYMRNGRLSRFPMLSLRF